MPTVSVITPTYNRSTTLSTAINSIQAQTYSDYEHIIVDDGSTDNTESVVKSFDDERIQYIALESNQGANVARNKGIQKSNGEYIAFLDSDDQFHRKKLEICVTKLDELNDDTAGVFHSAYFIRDGKLVDVSRAQEGVVGLERLQYGNPIGGFSDVVFRSEVFRSVGLLDDEMPAYQDYEFFLRVLRDFQMCGIEKPLSLKKKPRKKNSAARISNQLESKVQAQQLLLQKHPELISKRVKSEFYYTRGFLEAGRGDIKSARKQFKKAIALYSENPLYYYHYVATFGGDRGFRLAERFKKSAKLAISKKGGK